MERRSKKISRLLVFVFVLLIVGQSISVTKAEATPANKGSMEEKVEKLKSKTIPVGRVKKNKEGFKIEDVSIPSYDCMGMSYISVSDLKKVGGRIWWDSATGRTVIYDLNQPKTENPTFEPIAENAMGYLGRDAVYINYQEIPAVFVDGKALIPAKWIPTLLLDQHSSMIKTEEKIVETEKVAETKVDVINLETEDMKIKDLHGQELEGEEEVQEEVVEEEFYEVEKKLITGINIWFDGKDYIEVAYDFSDLKPGEFGYYQDLTYSENQDYMYVGYVISHVDEFSNNYEGTHKAWLKHSPYYVVPKEIVPEVVTALFPDTRVKGIMKYAAGGFAKGETVSVKQASSNSAYYLWNKSGNVVKVPWSSVAIQKSPVTKEQATTEQIEQYINSKDFTSKTNYFVWTDIYRQRTYVFKGSKNNWKLEKNFLSSTGKDTHLTPVGRYTLNVRVPYFGSSAYRVKNAYAFIGTSYLYHSVLFDKTGTNLLSSWGKLGNKASSGCIRLAVEDSVWFYKTLPIGTGIFIN